MNHHRFSQKKNMLCTGILALIPIVFTFSALEVYLLVSAPHIKINELTGRAAPATTQNPMVRWASLDAFSAYRGKPGSYSAGKTVNQNGFISTPDIAVLKTPNTLRIVFLGGSATAGTGHNLKDEETWPWVVQQQAP